MTELQVSKDVAQNRHEYIGGSDIAAILGMSRWKTPLKLWCEKTQKLPAPDLSNVEAVELGTDLEEFVAQKFTQKTVYRSGRWRGSAPTAITFYNPQLWGLFFERAFCRV